MFVDDVALQALLLEDQHRTFSVVHETGAAINPMTEIVQQVTTAAGESADDVGFAGRRNALSAEVDTRLSTLEMLLSALRLRLCIELVARQHDRP